MPIAVRDLFDEARVILQDETSVRWPLRQLRVYANAGARAIATAKPEAAAANLIANLVYGSRQTLQGQTIQLVRVVRNVGNLNPTVRDGRRAVTIVPRAVLDTAMPNWHNPVNTTPEKQVQHVVYDPADPRTFYVYPPNSGAGALEVVVTRFPDPIPAPDPDTNKLNQYSPFDLSLDAGYQNALVDYICYRAFDKDAAFTGNRERAQSHYGRFAEAIGLREQASEVNPNAQNSDMVPVSPMPGIR